MTIKGLEYLKSRESSLQNDLSVAHKESHASLSRERPGLKQHGARACEAPSQTPLYLHLVRLKIHFITGDVNALKLEYQSKDGRRE